MREATFTPIGKYIKMQFIFSSAAYPEYVNGGVNDVFGVWGNGIYAPFTPAVNGRVSIDTINDSLASNLYIDNPAASDLYNTEMDGAPHVLSVKEPVNSGSLNRTRISLAYGGDKAYDTNALIAWDTVLTITLAFDDPLTIKTNTATTVDVLADDVDNSNTGQTITAINGTDVAAGTTVTLPTVEQVTLNADNTLTIRLAATTDSEPFTYSVIDGQGNTGLDTLPL